MRSSFQLLPRDSLLRAVCSPRFPLLFWCSRRFDSDPSLTGPGSDVLELSPWGRTRIYKIGFDGDLDRADHRRKAGVDQFDSSDADSVSSVSTGLSELTLGNETEYVNSQEFELEKYIDALYEKRYLYILSLSSIPSTVEGEDRRFLCHRWTPFGVSVAVAAVVRSTVATVLN
ncbi:hypothetical protein GW17_00013088 [Ensete ventricosum]|nr:hypothetical protein GW17_00013088 [Ensete ventricosum]